MKDKDKSEPEWLRACATDGLARDISKESCAQALSFFWGSFLGTVRFSAQTMVSLLLVARVPSTLDLNNRLYSINDK